MSDISRRAKAFIEDDFVKDEFKKLEHLQYDIISNSGGYDYEERESAYRMLKAIQLIIHLMLNILVISLPLYLM